MSSSDGKLTRFTEYLSRPAVMQSFEKRAVLKTTTPDTFVKATMEPGTENRKGLAIASVPFVALLAWCCLTFVVRSSESLSEHSTNNVSHIPASQAKTLVGDLLSSLKDEKITTDALQVSQQSAYSVRRKQPIGEWDVTYPDKDHQYLVRINATTGRIYAINRVPAKTVPLAIARPATPPPTQYLSPDQAKVYALHYLKLNGVDTHSVQLIYRTQKDKPSELSETVNNSEDTGYSFTFDQRVPGVGKRLVKVAVNMHTGALEYFWNPSAAM